MQQVRVANIYFSMHDIDLVNNTLREIKTHVTNISSLFTEPVGNAQQIIFDEVLKSTHVMSQKALRDFVDFSTLEEMFGESNTITEEFPSSSNVWCRARLVISKCGADGKLGHVLWLVESIDEEKRKRDLLTEAAQTLNYRISSISNIHMTVHEIDIASDTFIEIKADNNYLDDSENEVHANAQKTLVGIMETYSDDSFTEDLLRFVDFSTLEHRLRRTDTVAIEYMNNEKLRRRGRFIVSRRDNKGKLTHILWLVEVMRSA